MGAARAGTLAAFVADLWRSAAARSADPLRSASTGCEDQRAVRSNGNGVLRVGTA